MVQNHRNKIPDNIIIDCYNNGMNLNETAAKIGMTTISLWRRSKKIGIKWSSLKKKAPNKIPLDEILEGLHPYYQTFKLKNRLISEGIKENKCEICEISEWNGKELKMQLDHKDGDSHNHNILNLQMICPNCHSQTITYCGKNIK
jgi:hypothetical protein